MFTLVGLLIGLLGIPLAIRKVPPNRLYSVRLRQTLQDENMWYEANATCGVGMIALGLILVVATLIMSLANIETRTSQVSSLTLLSVGMLAVIGIVLARIRKLSGLG